MIATDCALYQIRGGCDVGCVQASLVDLTVDVDLSVPERRTSAVCNVVERPVT
jgi:hypothetical protein